MAKIIIGFTGSFGSGCSYVADRYFVQQQHYKLASLSAFLRADYVAETGNDNPTRQELQAHGDKLRREKSLDYLAKQAIDKINHEGGDLWVVDSIRNPHEVTALREEFTGFYLMAVYADYQTRWKRSEDEYGKDARPFALDDERDADEGLDYGQRVTDCYVLADIIVSNTDPYSGSSPTIHETLRTQLSRLEGLIQGSIPFEPTAEEAIMAMAFANSLRSSCLKRKVGAVIVDRGGHAFSTGYNEVPWNTDPCIKDGQCQRQKLRAAFEVELRGLTDPAKAAEIAQEFRKRFKNLDYCRAMHAEEMAIVNVARFGNSTAVDGARLYATTFPCNLCANKIVTLGIKEVVYLEPYPMQEAKEILTNANVQQLPFAGVSFNGYFRFKKKV